MILVPYAGSIAEDGCPKLSVGMSELGSLDRFPPRALWGDEFGEVKLDVLLNGWVGAGPRTGLASAGVWVTV